MARMSPSLQNGGQGVILGIPDHKPPMMIRKTMAPTEVSGLSIQDMEGALKPKLLRRPPEAVRSSNGSQTARALLEDNKQLIAEKQERKAMARKNSREEFEKLVMQDRLTTEGERAVEINRRNAQRELAQYYKEKIGVKEQEKASEYSTKRDTGVENQYFPFIEGETIDKNRQAKRANMREEMREFLQQKREERPPRPDRLAADVRGGHLEYPVDPVPGRPRPGNGSSTARSLPPPSAAPSGGAATAEYAISVASAAAEEDVSPHLARYPRFLSKAQEHMSRRLQDNHVRKALEDKVLQTKAELEAAARRRELEAQQWEEGMLVNDALRYDRDQAKLAERKRNAQVLQEQIQKKMEQAKREREERQSERAGYWGPEEKGQQSAEIHREHCTDLIKQMEVDQRRRLNSRGQRLLQERALIDNCIAEMSQDREKERTKQRQHREVLTTTWSSQQKIKQAMKTLGQV